MIDLSAKRIAKMYSNTKMSGDCMLWQGMRDEYGGRITIGGKEMYVHRVSYQLAFGSLGRRRVRQTCGNKLCINPAHLTRKSLEDLPTKRERLVEELAQIDVTLAFMDTYILHK